MNRKEQEHQISAANAGVKDLSDKFFQLSEKFKGMNSILIVLVIALFVGFAGIFVAATQVLYDAWTNKAVTYEELKKQVADYNNLTKEQRDTIKEQNDKIDLIIEGLQKYNILPR